MLGSPIIVFQSARTQGLIMGRWAEHWRTWLLKLIVIISIDHLLRTFGTWGDFIFPDYHLSVSDNDSTSMFTIQIWIRLVEDAAILLSKLIDRVQVLGLERGEVSDLLIEWYFTLQVDFD